MARLYIGQREMDFFNDIAKEIIKDVNLQEIFYYPISSVKSNIHKVYEEATRKVFENPIKIEVMVEWMPSEKTTTKFGHDGISKIKVFAQSRDLIQREIEPKEGDYFTYGSETFEVTMTRTENNIYGQVEYEEGVSISGIQTRKDVFSTIVKGPTSEYYTDEDAVKTEFKQQRGITEGDKRDLVDNGVLDAPIVDTPAEVSRKAPAGKKPRSGFFGDHE